MTVTVIDVLGNPWQGLGGLELSASIMTLDEAALVSQAAPEVLNVTQAQVRHVHFQVLSC